MITDSTLQLSLMHQTMSNKNSKTSKQLLKSCSRQRSFANNALCYQKYFMYIKTTFGIRITTFLWISQSSRNKERFHQG